MANWTRKQIGKVVKKSEDKQRYPNVKEFSIKIDQDITLKAGQYLNLENKAFKLASLEANRAKMGEDNYNKALERIEKTPDWVFFEILQVVKD